MFTGKITHISRACDLQYPMVIKSIGMFNFSSFYPGWLPASSSSWVGAAIFQFLGWCPYIPVLGLVPLSSSSWVGAPIFQFLGWCPYIPVLGLVPISSSSWVGAPIFQFLGWCRFLPVFRMVPYLN